MTFDRLRELPRSVWISVGAWAIALLACVLLWVFRVGGDLRTLGAVRQRLAATAATVAQMKRDIAARPQLDALAAAVGSELHAITNAHVLTPTLASSYAVTAKSLLSVAAADAGFSIVETREKYRVPLPVPSPRPNLHFDRIGIEVEGVASYDAVARFIAEVEETLPYAALAGLRISGQRNDPESHKALVLLEWPVQGVPPPLPPPPKAKRPPPAAKKKGK
jgi:hypothetical protein